MKLMCHMDLPVNRKLLLHIYSMHCNGITTHQILMVIIKTSFHPSDQVGVTKGSLKCVEAEHSGHELLIKVYQKGQPK